MPYRNASVMATSYQVASGDGDGPVFELSTG
jgi:hypothetical protein